MKRRYFTFLLFLLISLVSTDISAVNISGVNRDSKTDVTVTDISQLTDAIYIVPFSALIGGDVPIEIRLKNAEAATAYVFDLVLPEGVTIAKNDKGKYIDALSSRHYDHSRTLYYKGNNTYSFAALSGNSEELTGNDGAIRLLTLHVADSATEGTYAIIIKNASYSNPDGTLVNLASTTSAVVLSLEDVPLGDANGDNIVNIADVTAIINRINGIVSDHFNAATADVNKDGLINIADVTGVINIINR